MSDNTFNQIAEDIFRKHGGTMRMSQALDAGISRYRFYKMRDQGIIQEISRGVFRLSELPPINHVDLVTVALRYPDAVVCLLSSLAFHELTTQIPHRVNVAVTRRMRLPNLDFPPISAHRFSEAAYQAGIMKHQLDGVDVQVYDPEKTLVDCFKFRNKIGMDIVQESMRLYRDRKLVNIPAILRFARICRVERPMRPYLEALL